MKGVVLTQYDAEPSKNIHLASDLPIPTPKQLKANEIIVRVHAVSLNPLDYKIASGKMSLIYRIKSFPWTMGSDFSGTVVAVGAKVHDFKIGEAVMGCNFGALADFSVTPVSCVAHRPQIKTKEGPKAFYSWTETAALPLVLQTAWNGCAATLENFSRKFPNRQPRCLVLNSTGGVGTHTIQLMKRRWNAHVTATCSEANAAWVQETLGADQTIDYHKDWAEEFKDQNFDLIFDGVGGQQEWHRALRIWHGKPKGHFSTLVGDNQHEPVTVGRMFKLGAGMANRGFWSAIGVNPAYQLVMTMPGEISGELENICVAPSNKAKFVQFSIVCVHRRPKACKKPLND
eukprot:GABV01008622.1.p1 GENE.GABV01008622.1~~GABV01008622.1.p1  ORF type:complete len:344 (-),score=107.66 GABV01008622.1:310-1341(-)